jgi:hypothetical protein
VLAIGAGLVWLLVKSALATYRRDEDEERKAIRKALSLDSRKNRR